MSKSETLNNARFEIPDAIFYIMSSRKGDPLKSALRQVTLKDVYNLTTVIQQLHYDVPEEYEKEEREIYNKYVKFLNDFKTIKTILQTTKSKAELLNKSFQK